MEFTLEDIDEMLGQRQLAEQNPVSANELAGWLGISANRIHYLAREGVLPRDDSMNFPLKSSVAAYCRQTRSGLTGRQVDSELASEKLRLAKANAEKAETANAKARGDLIAAVEVEREWAAVLRGVRAAMLALPSRVAQRLGHLSPHDVAEIDREVRDALEELAND